AGAYPLPRPPQPVGGDLRIGGLVALAVGLGADRDRHRAVALETHLRALVGRAARSLEEAADADAAQLAACLRRRTPRSEARKIGARHGGIEIGDKAARIDG